MKFAATASAILTTLSIAALGAGGCSSGSQAGAVTDASADGPVVLSDGGKRTFAACAPDESAPVPANRCTTDSTNTALPQCGTWLKVEIPGTVCSDGSQYKFFVNYSNKSNDLEVNFEPGGACWDYDSCSGAGGVRGAANPHGIPDDHMTQLPVPELLAPHEG